MHIQGGIEVSAVWQRIQDEPAMTLAVIQAAIALFVAFGLNLSGDQVGAIVAVTAAFLGWVTRSQVTPVARA